MLEISGYNFELPTMNKNPKFGFVMEYTEKKTINGTIIRKPKGKRFKAEFSYAYLTPEQLLKLLNLAGYAQLVKTQIPEQPAVTLMVHAYVEIDDILTRYAYINDEWVWTDIKVTLTGVDLS